MKTIKLLILSLLLLGTTLFANSIATITAIKGSATVLRDTSNIKAKLGLKLNVKDTIKTHDNTKVQIIFDDETIVSLGKNSNFSINEFLFDGDKEPVAKFAMLRGAMRVITGKIGKIAPQKFSVSTKTATIGIRGTNFTVIANDDGSYQVYCTYGAISVTINGVEYVVEQGYYINISPSGEAKILEFTPESLKQMRIAKFGLVQNRVAQVSEDGQSTDDKVSDDDPLNITINDNTEVVIQDISEQNSNNIQNATLSLSELLASYSLNGVVYNGTLSNVTSQSGLISNGDPATFTIDFGSDTASLVVGNAPSNSITFSSNPNFSGETITVGTGSNHTATGTFQSPTGNQILGNYNDQGQVYLNKGNFDVSTNTVLH